MRRFMVVLGLLFLCGNADARANGLADLSAERLQRMILDEPPTGPRARKVVHRDSTPREAVLDMFDAYRRRSLPEYLAWFDPEFRFDSDDSTFRAHYANGMSLSDEVLYSSRLLAGKESECTGLPYATRVRLSLRWLNTSPTRPTAGLATVVLEGLRVRIDLSDGDEFDSGEAHHELLMARTEDGWRVRRWLESDRTPQGTLADSTASAPTDSSAARAVADRSAIPARLGVTAFADHSLNALGFSVGLPREGGVLELFDVQGRRVASRDLDGLRPGYHRISLDGGAWSAGIYWARVRQGELAATARVVWMR